MRRDYIATLASIERPVHLRIQVATPGYDGAIYRLTLDDAEGRGFVALNAPHWSASYFWPAHGRGTIQGSGSLLAFLLQCDVSYVAGKLGVSDDFDAVATERAIKVELWRGNRSRYREILRDCPPDFEDAPGWDRWLDRYVAAGYDRGLDVNDPWERFAPIRVIRPDFEVFYRVAWPLLREQRARIENELYPKESRALPEQREDTMADEHIRKQAEGSDAWQQRAEVAERALKSLGHLLQQLDAEVAAWGERDAAALERVRYLLGHLDRARAAGEALQQPVTTDAQDAASAAEEDAQELAEVLALLDREQVPREHQDGRPLTPVQRVAWLAEDIVGRKALAVLVGNPEGWPVMLSRQSDTGAVLARLGQDQVVRPTLGRALRALARARDEQDRP